MNQDCGRSPWIGLEMHSWGVIRKLEVVGWPCIPRHTLWVQSVQDLRWGITTYLEPYPSYLALPLHLCSFLPILLTSHTRFSIPNMLCTPVLESQCTSNLALHTPCMVFCAWWEPDPLYVLVLRSLPLSLPLCLQLRDASTVDHPVSTHLSL